jgi:tetratricopeptide (TPR) repeat protein
VNRLRRVIGREPQLAAAEALLDDLDRFRGGLLVLVGEAGIGKTRLAEEIVSVARTRGARTAWASAWQVDGAPPLWPWVQILRQLAGSSASLGHPQPETPAAAAAAQFAQCEAVAGHLLEAAAESALVVVVDNLHWADAASRRVLTFIASAVRDARCLVVATCRADELSPEDMAELAQVGTSLTIPRLPDDDAAELLRTAVGADVSSAATGLVVARSAGNPLFLWEFGQLMAQSGRLDVAPAGVPRAVAGVIERRLARVPHDVVALLQVVAVLGGSCTTDVVATVADVTADDAVAGLSTAVAVGILTEEVPESVAFSHDLVRDVVLSGLDVRRRLELHRRAAAALERRLALDPSFHAVVADHLSKAGAGQSDAASQHWESAGFRASSLLAYDEAARCFARASRATGSDADRYARLLVAEGEALVLAGNLELARARYTDAATAARTVGNPELLARAVLGIGTGPLSWEVPIGDEQHADLVAEALALLPEEDKALRSTLLARLSVSGSTPETLDVAGRRAREALELAQEVGDPVLIGQALAALNDALGGPSHTMTRRENADAMVELALAAGDRSLELLGYRFRIVADLESGDVPAVDRDIAAFTRLAEGLRQPLISWFVPLFRGMRALMAGDVDAADRHQAEVAAAAQATGSVNADLLSTTLRFGIDVACGRDTAPDFFNGFKALDPAAWGSLGAGLAMVKWHAGEHEAARDLLRLHADSGFVRLGEDSDYLVSLTFFGRVAAALGETGAAASVYELLGPYSGLWVVDGIAGCCWGPVDLEQGRLAVALGRHADAREHLAAALDAVEQAGAVMLAAEVRVIRQAVADAEASMTKVADRDTIVGSPDDVDDPGLGNVFHRDGSFWTLAYRQETVRIRDAKGLRDLARLLAEPRREFHVLDLAGRGGAPVGSGGADHDDHAGGDLGELLDARARAEYRRRLAELDDELEDAEACADPVRAERARDERDFLLAELSSALGLGGRPRRTGDPVERARKAVSGRIRLTIGRIEHEHAALGRHLRNAVRTGTYCAYEPETPTTWLSAGRSGIATSDVAPPQ